MLKFGVFHDLKRNINILIVSRKYVHHRTARTDLLMYYCCRNRSATVLLNYVVRGPKQYYSFSYLTDDLLSTNEVMIRKQMLLHWLPGQTHSLGFDMERIGPDEAGIIVWAFHFLVSVFRLNDLSE